jgi:hypothetical protein
MGALEAWDQRLGAAAREAKDGGGDAGGLGARQRAFWTNVCICNTLIVERGPDGEYVYQVRAKRLPVAQNVQPAAVRAAASNVSRKLLSYSAAGMHARPSRQVRGMKLHTGSNSRGTTGSSIQQQPVPKAPPAARPSCAIASACKP